MDPESQVTLALTFAEAVTLAEMLNVWGCQSPDGLPFRDEAEDLALNKLEKALQQAVKPGLYGLDYELDTAWAAVRAAGA